MAAKPKNVTQPQQEEPTTEVKHAGTPFRRLAAVRVPTLKLTDDSAIFVKVTGAIREIPKTELGEGGVAVTKTIAVVPVVDLQTGEIAEIVAGAALVQILRDYKGGNSAYVGLCYEITKHTKAEGKRWKAYSVFEIEAPKGEAPV